MDIIKALTKQSDHQIARKYWNKLSERLKAEGSQVLTNCHRLKMKAEDGKMRLTDVADTETLLRLIQPVPSPKAEPIKLWLAKGGYERLQEIQDPEQSINRARENWKRNGMSQKWIQKRMMGQETRNKLTDYWSNHGVKEGKEFAILTKVIHQEWTDMTVKKHKELKGIQNQNLRDHMSEAELIFTALSEFSTRSIAATMGAEGLDSNKVAGKKGRGVGKHARLELEGKTGKKIITSKNHLGDKQKKSLK